MKKITGILTLACVLSVFTTGVVHAENMEAATSYDASVVDGDCNVEVNEEDWTWEKQTSDIINHEDMTQEEKEKALTKIEESKKILEGSNDSSIKDSDTTSYASSYSSFYCFTPDEEKTVTLRVPFYAQQNGYYCGPATAQQTLGYINGTAGLESQDSIYKQINSSGNLSDTNGSVYSKLQNYVNSRQNRNFYLLANPANASKMAELTQYSLRHTNAPIIIDIKARNTSEWKYKTNGHYLNISGQYPLAKTYQLTDPNICRVNSSYPSGKYYESIDRVYQVVINHSPVVYLY